jgi:hypothetical protein
MYLSSQSGGDCSKYSEADIGPDLSASCILYLLICSLRSRRESSHLKFWNVDPENE